MPADAPAWQKLQNCYRCAKPTLLTLDRKWSRKRAGFELASPACLPLITMTDDYTDKGFWAANLTEKLEYCSVWWTVALMLLLLPLSQKLFFAKLLITLTMLGKVEPDICC